MFSGYGYKVFIYEFSYTYIVKATYNNKSKEI